MPLTLNEVYQSTKDHYHLSLLTGNSGIHNIMNWVYVSEDYTTHDFLKGGELIITTGVNCQTEESLYAFLSAMIQSHTCGIIINTGKYIFPEDITTSIKNLCTKHHYPLILMPWHVHIYDITRDYYNRIFLDTQIDHSITNAFFSIIQKDNNLDSAQKTLESHGFSDHSEYCISILHCSDSEIPDELKQRLLFQIESFTKTKNAALHAAFFKNMFLLICHGVSFDKNTSIMKELLGQLKKYYGDLHFYIGIGSITNRLKELSISYHRAAIALIMGKYRKTSIFSFNEMGFFRLLHSIDDLELLKQYCAEYLSEISNYDVLHQTNYLETLHQYLLHNGSIQLIASNMFCHRNTVSYRINVIKDLWKLDLENIQTRFHLMTAFQIKEYLELLEL